MNGTLPRSRTLDPCGVSLMAWSSRTVASAINVVLVYSLVNTSLGGIVPRLSTVRVVPFVTSPLLL